MRNVESEFRPCSPSQTRAGSCLLVLPMPSTIVCLKTPFLFAAKTGLEREILVRTDFGNSVWLSKESSGGI